MNFVSGTTRNHAWRDSLIAMRNSLVSTYELGTAFHEQEHFIEAWESGEGEIVVFCDYRRNEGRRRLLDVTELIDQALARIEQSDSLEASMIYTETLRAIALVTKWVKVLETSVTRHGS